MQPCTTHSSAHASKFSFLKKFQGAQILILFGEYWHEASFYIKKQTQKYKFEIWLFKSTILDPRKSAFWGFKENPKKKFFCVCFGFDSTFKTIDAQMYLWSIFLKTHKKVIDRQKRHFGCFWWLITVFICVFKNSDQNNICASIVFKDKTKENYEEIFFFYGFYFKTQKYPFLGVNQFFKKKFMF